MLWLWYSLLVGGWCSWWVASVLVPHQQLYHLHPHRWLHGSHLLGFIRLCFWVGSISVPSSSWDRSPFLASHCTPHTSAMCSICTMHKCTHQQFISVPESWDTVFGDVCCALQCIWKTLRCSAQHNWIGRVHPLVCGKMKRLVEMCSGWICVTGQWWSELGIIPTYSLDLVDRMSQCSHICVYHCYYLNDMHGRRSTAEIVSIVDRALLWLYLYLHLFLHLYIQNVHQKLWISANEWIVPCCVRPAPLSGWPCPWVPKNLGLPHILVIPPIWYYANTHHLVHIWKTVTLPSLMGQRFQSLDK